MAEHKALRAIADGAQTYDSITNGWLSKVYNLDGWQAAVDGHILAVIKGDVDGLPLFPASQGKRCSLWLGGTIDSLSINGTKLREFCDPAVYAKNCETCKGTALMECYHCAGFRKEQKKNCDECRGTAKIHCDHDHAPSDYGFIGEVLFNRSIIWKILAYVDDCSIAIQLNGKTDKMRLDGKDWKAVIMPVRQDNIADSQLRSYAKFKF